MGTMVPNLFYRYKRAFKIHGNNPLSVGDIYQFLREKDFRQNYKKEFLLGNSSGEKFELTMTYSDLDDTRLEDVFEEVPRPSWWDSNPQFSGY
jgi:hypothetical protein